MLIDQIRADLARVNKIIIDLETQAADRDIPVHYLKDQNGVVQLVPLLQIRATLLLAAATKGER